MFYTFTGNTYRNRHLLNSRTGIGAEWHPDFKVWMVRASGNGLDSILWRLRRSGVKVECHGTTAPPAWVDRYGA